MEQWVEKIDPYNPLSIIAKKWKKNQRLVSLSYSSAIEKVKFHRVFADQKIDGQTALLSYDKGKAVFASISGRLMSGFSLSEEVEKILRNNNIFQALIVGEMAGYRDGKILPFDETQSLIKSRDANKSLVHWFPYQILEINREFVARDFESYISSRKILDNLFKDASYIHPSIHYSDFEKAWEELVERQGNEGLVVHLDDGNIYKVRPVYTYDLVVVAVGDKELINWGKGLIGNTLVAFLDEQGNFRISGEVGTGWTQKERRELFDWARQNKVHDDKNYTWVYPEKIMEVQWDRSHIRKAPAYKFQDNSYIRQNDMYVGTIVKPRFIRWREDKKVNSNDLRLDQIPDWKDFQVKRVANTMNNNMSDALYKIKKNLGRYKYLVMLSNPYRPISKITQNTGLKPRGLWYSCGLEWIDWVIQNEPAWTRTYIYSLTFNSGKILQILNDNELDDFIEKYEKNSYEVYWNEVSELYDGIEMNPYNHRRYGWSSTWDVSSGCIWNSSSIIKMELLYKYNQETGQYEEPSSKNAAYPDNPDEIVIHKKEHILGGPNITELDIWNYYTGDVVTEMLKEFRGKNLFIVLKPRGILKAGEKPIYLRHPYGEEKGYIRIGNQEEFEVYHSGRYVEYHSTLGAQTDLYIVDFDGVGDWDHTKKVTSQIAHLLKDLPETKGIQIRYTGKRGFHVLANLRRSLPINEARDTLRGHLQDNFGSREDLVIGESPVGRKGALGISPMKINGGHIALWSMRVTGLCCIEVSEKELDGFKKESARPHFSRSV